MDSIEEKLKQAMKRVDPPEGFVARVLARVEAQGRVAKASQPSSGWFDWLWNLASHPVPATAMVLILLLVLGIGLGHLWRPEAPSISEQERVAGQKASAQLMFALQITGAQLSRMHALLSQPQPGAPTTGASTVQPEFSK